VRGQGRWGGSWLKRLGNEGRSFVTPSMAKELISFDFRHALQKASDPSSRAFCYDDDGAGSLNVASLESLILNFAEGSLDSQVRLDLPEACECP
jgi:hypothetical protein